LLKSKEHQQNTIAFPLKKVLPFRHIKQNKYLKAHSMGESYPTLLKQTQSSHCKKSDLKPTKHTSFFREKDIGIYQDMT